MATVTDADYGDIRDALYQAAAAKADLKALPALPTKAQLRAAFQAIETRFDNARPALKADIDTALGRVTTAALARKIMIAWLRWKLRQLEGE